MSDYERRTARTAKHFADIWIHVFRAVENGVFTMDDYGRLHTAYNFIDNSNAGAASFARKVTDLLRERKSTR